MLVREQPAEAETNVSGEVAVAKDTLFAREKARFRFKQLKKGTRDSREKFFDNLINNINTVPKSTSRIKFRPLGNRGGNLSLNFCCNHQTEAHKMSIHPELITEAPLLRRRT